ncbi:SOS response-associated peptidase [Geoalkalibacter halelectricus]|uniref:Abasic site processing protein n=1 Tax=Geoalkalibacter halelectricus TaxID=2847045 RepID=A0ABY5ZLK0_9BACT|nr:SOS response-associated peptidase [Geoalkalibacter halelectricus]MDO3377202.1 SOS response-associated peptidase [Geoalkalibacter halelectricus]UWZ79334.1 SOS response-associated peptidase [Geoalkalibacter halelectricus]
MCGRYALFIDLKTLIEAFGLSLPQSPENFTPRYNIAPTQQVLGICQNADGFRHLKWFRWGLIPHWAKDASIGNRMINARCETVHEKPSFRNALRYRRCLIPSSGFFEWKAEGKGKQPYFIRRKDQAPLALAGLWDSWKGPDETIESCTILTTEANPLVANLHDRMPVILSPSEYDTWLDREVDDPGKLQSLFQPFPSDLLEMQPVSTDVNNPLHEGEGCLAAAKSSTSL